MNLPLSELERKFLNEILKNLTHVKTTNQVFTISEVMIDSYFTNTPLPSNQASNIEFHISKFLQKNKLVKTPTDEVTYSFTEKGMELLRCGTVEAYELHNATIKDAENRKSRLFQSLSDMLSFVKLAQ